MRIGILRLYTGGSGKPGFYNIQELGLARSLAKDKNLEVYIFFLRDRKKFRNKEVENISDNIKIIYLPVKSIGNHGLINPNFIKEYGIDILHLNSDNQLNTSRIIKWCLRNETIVYNFVGTIESSSKNKLKRYISKIIFNINKIYQNKTISIAKTQNIHDYLISNGVKNVKLIPVGLDLDKLTKQENVTRFKLREKYNIPLEQNIMLFIGRLEEDKNPFKAIEILRYINECNENFSLLMVGVGTLKEKVVDKVCQYKLHNKFHYIEKIPNSDIWELYSLSDVFINMSDNEIFGMSILESMYYKCPVIALEAPGPNYIIKNGQTGFLVEDFDMGKWYKTIKSAIDNKERIGISSNEFIVEKLNWDVISKQYMNLYNELIQDNLRIEGSK